MSAQEWLAAGSPGGGADLVVLGAPIARASISDSQAQLTPPAFRQALARFTTWDADHGIDLRHLRVVDLGDIEGDEHDVDSAAAHARLQAAVGRAVARAPVVCVVGGDNSVTVPAVLGACGGAVDTDWGLLTLDAHHDVRPLDDGPRNGTPVRQLIEAGLPGRRIAQVGLHGMANEPEHARWVHEQGVLVRRASQVRSAGMAALLDGVLDSLSRAGAHRIHADLDMDVLDRAFAPGCPASMPGGLSPAEMQEAAFILGSDSRVVSVDLCEVDAAADVADITVRAMVSVFLAFCSGLAWRLRRTAAL